MTDRAFHVVEGGEQQESQDSPLAIRFDQFPHKPDGAAVDEHLWKGLPDFWDGNFDQVRALRVTPGGAAGRAFSALKEEGNNLTANALTYLLDPRTQLPEAWGHKMLLLAGTQYIDKKTGQVFVLGINTNNNKKALFRLSANASVPERTYALVFRD